MLILNVLISLALAPASARAYEESCLEALAQIKVTDDQFSALAEAGRVGYSIRVLTKTSGGFTRTVVLVGESLLKAPRVAQVGRRLSRAFTSLATGGDAKLNATWWPRPAEAYADRLMEREIAAAPADTSWTSLKQLADLEDRVLEYEDDVVRTMVSKRRSKQLVPMAIKASVESIEAKGGLATFDHADVRRRIEVEALERAPRRFIRLEDGYRPTVRHNAAVLYVLASEKLARLSGRIQKAITLLAAAGGLGWVAYTGGGEGKILTAVAASAFLTQVMIDFGRQKMIRGFFGTGSRSEQIAVELAKISSNTDEMILTALPESQTESVAHWMNRRGFSEDVYFPMREAPVTKLRAR